VYPITCRVAGGDLVCHVNWSILLHIALGLWDCICDVQQNLFLDGNVGLARGGVDGVDETLMSNNEGGR